MNRMNLIRSAISIFIVTLLALSIAGWMWAGGQPARQMEGARFVLGICGLSSLLCLWILWREKPAKMQSPDN